MANSAEIFTMGELVYCKDSLGQIVGHLSKVVGSRGIVNGVQQVMLESLTDGHTFDCPATYLIRFKR